MTVTIDYKLNGQTASRTFDYVIIACDPRALNVVDRTVHEQEVYSKLTSHTFHTTLWEATRPNRTETEVPGISSVGDPTVNFAVRFDPDSLDKMDGSVYGFRDEVMARDEDFQPNKSKSTWTVSYQLKGTPLLGKNPEEEKKSFNDKRKADIKDNIYIDWTPCKWTESPPTEDSDPVEDASFMVDYFPHFDSDGLAAGLPWTIWDNMGNGKTLYVASFTCFESVLHCFLCMKKLIRRMKNDSDFKERLPKKDDRIAVIGAGPSGLLFASQFLINQGYANFQIFEKEDRYGGKTNTVERPIASDSEDKNVICEMGTCYLSPAYFPLYTLFQKYDIQLPTALDGGSNKFRSIIESHRNIAITKQEQDDGVEFNKWCWRKNGKGEGIQKAKIGIAAIIYIIKHWIIMRMGPLDPLPDVPPTNDNIREHVKQIRSSIFGQSDDPVNLITLLKALVKKTTIFEGVDAEIIEKMVEVLETLASDVTTGSSAGVLDSVVPSDIFKCDYDIFDTPFKKYLQDNGMEPLIPTFVYSYQVQGYGTLENIPAYYG